MRISGYIFGRRKEFDTIEEAWSYGSQLVCLSNRHPLRFANIRTPDRLENWLNDGITAGLFKTEPEGCGGC